jgi:hypothetical protein
MVPPVAAVRSAPKPPPREPEITHGPPAPDDELAFLKSVSPGEEKKPAAPPPSPQPVATSSGRRSNPGGGSSGRATEAPAQTAPSKPGAAGVAKTLKCGECGTLNRPTEWYCERCGAELAGI